MLSHSKRDQCVCSARMTNHRSPECMRNGLPYHAGPRTPYLPRGTLSTFHIISIPFDQRLSDRLTPVHLPREKSLRYVARESANQRRPWRCHFVSASFISILYPTWESSTNQPTLCLRPAANCMYRLPKRFPPLRYYTIAPIKLFFPQGKKQNSPVVSAVDHTALY